jgi:biotin transport system substrate-specific component
MTSHTVTLTDVLVSRRGLARDLVLIGGAVWVTALAAQVTVFLPFTPVPITGQTLAVLLCAAALGSRRGAIAQLAYLGAGSAGIPVFAAWGRGLPIGPTGGYLLGFVAAAYVVGLLVERGWDRRMRTACLAMLAGNAVIYAFGLPWLALFVGGPLGKVLALGLWPFILGDLVKIALASALLPSAWTLVSRAGRRAHEDRSDR